MIAFFDAVNKTRVALDKWQKLTVTQRDLLSLQFLYSLCAKAECIEVEINEKKLANGKIIMMLRLSMDIGEFVFAIPKHSDSILVLNDFIIYEDRLHTYEVVVNAC